MREDSKEIEKAFEDYCKITGQEHSSNLNPLDIFKAGYRVTESQTAELQKEVDTEHKLNESLASTTQALRNQVDELQNDKEELQAKLFKVTTNPEVIEGKKKITELEKEIDRLEGRIEKILVSRKKVEKSRQEWFEEATEQKGKIQQLQKDKEDIQDLAFWMTGCGYDFSKHEHFLKNRHLMSKTPNL